MKKRNGDAATDNVLPKTANDAVKKPGADGKSTNALEVRVGADKIDYVVNGTVVGLVAEERGVRPTASTACASTTCSKCTIDGLSEAGIRRASRARPEAVL